MVKNIPVKAAISLIRAEMLSCGCRLGISQLLLHNPLLVRGDNLHLCCGGGEDIEMCITTEIIIVKDGKLFLASVLSFVRPYLLLDQSFFFCCINRKGEGR